MAKAYTKYIGLDKDSPDSHQTSPHWVLTFTRFNTRDTKNYGTLGPARFEPERNTLVVENDCISVSVSTSKTNNTPNANITLASGDLNYATAVAPGDFVIINMVNWTEKAREIRDRAVGNTPRAINRVGDGFKGVFKINSVSKVINTDPNSGVKTVRYQITAYGFTEFNNVIYFNPTLGKSISQLSLLYAISAQLFTVFNSKKTIHEILSLLPNIILGKSKIEATGESVSSTKKTPYVIPKDVFKLLGIKKGTHAVDLYRIMLGVWDNSASGTNMQEGFNPNYKENARVQSVGTLEGRVPVQTSPLTNVRLIDLLKRYSNDLINETYCCFRIDKETNAVLPKMIIRQKPFNTEHGVHKEKKKKTAPLKGTRFLTLPRWKISSDLIYSLNVSKNESLRFNFVHIIGTTGNPSLDSKIIAIQNADAEAEGGTIKVDGEDIGRHGLRPYTQVSNFDWPDGKKPSLAPYWASLVFDWIHSGQLKSNGKITTVGIQDDICIGDNLELQDTVYHIESITHMGTITPDGKKMFRTSLTLTHGVDKRSSAKGPVYPEMDYTDTYLDRIHDSESNYGIMPGFSDSQDIRGRVDGEEKKETGNKTYTPAGIKEKQKSTDKE